jgi:hypothetical protein
MRPATRSIRDGHLYDDRTTQITQFVAFFGFARDVQLTLGIAMAFQTGLFDTDGTQIAVTVADPFSHTLALRNVAVLEFFRMEASNPSGSL